MEDRWGATAASYLTSARHSDSSALSRMVSFVPPSSGVVLDIATGAGHAAFAFAPFVDEVVATDTSQGMLAVAREEALRRGLANVRFEIADAMDLPFPDASFDGIVCRVAAHHFSSVDRFLDECHRVLVSDGWLLVVDTVGSDDPAADDQIHLLESLRDPTHFRDHTVAAWHAMALHVGFAIEKEEVEYKPLIAKEWLERQRVAPDVSARIVSLIEGSSEEYRSYLQPTGTGAELTFHLAEAMFLMRNA